jgi:hypothetical protein
MSNVTDISDELLEKNLAAVKARKKPVPKKTEQAKPERKSGWRLNRTLRRYVEARPAEPEHMAYIWAAYKRGSLDRLDPAFEDHELDPAAFHETFMTYLVRSHNEVVIFYAHGKKGYGPIGFAASWLSNRILTIGKMVWFPEATPRAIVESVVNFVNSRRRRDVILGFADEPDTKFFVVLCKHGILRTVGHINDSRLSHRVTVFQSKELL